MARCWLYVLLFCSTLTELSLAQHYEYVVLFMENYVEEALVPENVELYVASRSSSPVTVNISNPAGNILSSPISFNLDAEEKVKTFSLPPSARQTGDLDSKAIKVVSNGDIIVYALNRNLFSSDGFTAFNVDDVDKEYYALAYTAEYNTQIGLVAIEDGATDVEIYVPELTAIQWTGIQHNTGEIVKVSLTYQYQTALIKSLVGDLTGARIVATKKIAAFSGNVRTKVEGNSRDHLVDQLPPLIQWGFRYYTVRTPARTPDRPDVIRVVAHEDNTQVEVRGDITDSFVLNAGQFKEMLTFGSVYIDSGNRSVMVGVFSTSQSKDDLYKDTDEGDPSMIIMPAEGQYSADYVFSTPQYIKPPNSFSTEYDIYVLIIVKTSEANGLTLNDVPLNTDNWLVIAGTNYSSGQIRVNNSATYSLMHTDSNARFMALLYGSADRESFYFPIDVGMDNINVVAPVEVQGNQGEKGTKGDRGVQGAAGLKGAQGEIGDKGEPGIPGLDGEKGDKGAFGFPSAIGATGASGDMGQAGATGVTGSKGVRGATGSTGIKGPTGVRGPTGDRGPTGSTGTKGEPGDFGAIGYRGTAGSPGAKGEEGVQGPKGVNGPTGATGAKGSVTLISCNGKCSTKDSNQPTTCHSTFGNYNHLCSCSPGFHLTDNSPNICRDIDECALGICSHGCTNTVGSYTCSCPEGYELLNNNCIDIDECNRNDNPCGSNVCVNGIGHFLCLSPSAPEPQRSFEGLKTLFNRDFFIAVLCLLVILSLLVIIIGMCLLGRLRKRNRSEKPSKQFISEQTYVRPVVYQNGYYR